MYIIQLIANPGGGRPALQAWSGEAAPEGYALCPDEFCAVFYGISPAGFVNITVEEGMVTAMEVNQEAVDAWNAEHTPPNPLETAREEKLAEVNSACDAAITAGCDVTLSDGTTGHISLTLPDQINLTTARGAIQNGAVGYAYHLDGALCKVYPAEDIVIMAQTATSHAMYHQTYCNHVRAWAKRVETLEELESITYGAELPADLKEHMEAVLTAASGVMNG